MLLLSHCHYQYYCYCYCDEDLEQGGVVAMMLTMMKSCDCSCWMRTFVAEVG